MLKSNKNAAYIIAEVGQNHQGDLKIAKNYIEEFSKRGADAIKFQKRSNENLFSKEKLNQLYDNENSFGYTYGEHRNYLEFDINQMNELKEVCNKFKIDFICTPFDEKSLEELIQINTKIFKIASFDMGNLSLITKLIKSNSKFILSCGGSNLDIITKTVSFILKKNKDFTLLHCVSNYPALPEELQLYKIKEYKKLFSKVQIGLSDHFNGPLSGPVGFLHGAEVFEKHVTFNRAWKGTDHSFSLLMSGFEQFVKDINRTKIMGEKNINSEKQLGNEFVFKKLGKSIIANSQISKNEYFSEMNLSGKILKETIVPVRNMINLIGRKSKFNYNIGDPISFKEIDVDNAK